ATRKQVKRRKKARVHGYVREGTEQPARAEREPRSERRAGRSSQRQDRSRGWVRTPPEPTWQRSLKRTGTLVVPFLLLIWYFIGKPEDHTVETFATTVILPSVLFIPFDYDGAGFMNKMLKRRMARWASRVLNAVGGAALAVPLPRRETRIVAVAYVASARRPWISRSAASSRSASTSIWRMRSR